MDWSKAKNILIVALLITNLGLIAAIYMGGDGSDSAGQEDLRANTVILLKEHDIHVEEELIPDRNQNLGVLSVRYRNVSPERISEAIVASGIHLDDEADDADYTAAAGKLLRTMDIENEGVFYVKVLRDGAEVRVRYNVGFDKYPLDNSEIVVTFRDGVPVEVDADWAEPVSMGRNRKRVLSAATALVKFMTVRETAGETEPVFVEEIELVYWLESYNTAGGVSEDTAVPYWRIGYNDGQRAYIAAYEQ